MYKFMGDLNKSIKNLLNGRFFPLLVETQCSSKPPIGESGESKVVMTFLNIQ